MTAMMTTMNSDCDKDDSDEGVATKDNNFYSDDSVVNDGDGDEGETKKIMKKMMTLIAMTKMATIVMTATINGDDCDGKEENSDGVVVTMMIMATQV